jgi:hypothetical protein
MEFSVGDRIENLSTGKVIEILQVRATGYTWRTVSAGRDVHAYAYRTDESDDPFLEQGWRLRSQASSGST